MATIKASERIIINVGIDPGSTKLSAAYCRNEDDTTISKDMSSGEIEEKIHVVKFGNESFLDIDCGLTGHSSDPIVFGPAVWARYFDNSATHPLQYVKYLVADQPLRDQLFGKTREDVSCGRNGPRIQRLLQKAEDDCRDAGMSTPSDLLGLILKTQWWKAIIPQVQKHYKLSDREINQLVLFDLFIVRPATFGLEEDNKIKATAQKVIDDDRIRGIHVLEESYAALSDVLYRRQHVSASFGRGYSILTIDCGGSTIDCSANKIYVEKTHGTVNKFQTKEICEPIGNAEGFHQIFARLQAAINTHCRSMWEGSNESWPKFVVHLVKRSEKAIETYTGGKFADRKDKAAVWLEPFKYARLETSADLVEQFQKHGFLLEAQRLGISHWKLMKLFQSLVEPTIKLIEDLAEKFNQNLEPLSTKGEVSKLQKILITGGYARNAVVKKLLSDGLRTDLRELIEFVADDRAGNARGACFFGSNQMSTLAKLDQVMGFKLSKEEQAKAPLFVLDTYTQYRGPYPIEEIDDEGQ